MKRLTTAKKILLRPALSARGRNALEKLRRRVHAKRYGRLYYRALRRFSIQKQRRILKELRLEEISRQQLIWYLMRENEKRKEKRKRYRQDYYKELT